MLVAGPELEVVAELEVVVAREVVEALEVMGPLELRIVLLEMLLDDAGELDERLEVELRPALELLEAGAYVDVEVEADSDEEVLIMLL